MNEQEKKALIQRTFNAVSGGYDIEALRFFAKSAENLPAYLKLKGDEHVLDVATGTGHVAITLAGHLPKGKIVGIDFSEGMLASAKNKLKAMYINNVELHHMDMQSLDFPDNHFDIAVSAFSLFFVDDMNLQLCRIADKVKPGGKIIATSFLGGPFSKLSEIFFNDLKEFGVVIDPASMRRLSNKAECAIVFNCAGLTDLRIDNKNVGYYIKDSGQWWDVVWNAGFRRYVGMIAPEKADGFKKEHLKRIDSLATKDGIWLDVKVLYTSGIKPL